MNFPPPGMSYRVFYPPAATVPTYEFFPAAPADTGPPPPQLFYYSGPDNNLHPGPGTRLYYHAPDPREAAPPPGSSNPNSNCICPGLYRRHLAESWVPGQQQGRRGSPPPYRPFDSGPSRRGGGNRGNRNRDHDSNSSSSRDSDRSPPPPYHVLGSRDSLETLRERYYGGNRRRGMPYPPDPTGWGPGYAGRDASSSSSSSSTFRDSPRDNSSRGHSQDSWSCGYLSSRGSSSRDSSSLGSSGRNFFSVDSSSRDSRDGWRRRRRY